MADKDFVVKNGLTVNGSILVVNTSTNRVGIGTSTPDANLTVSGTANVSGNAVFSSNVSVTGTILGSANATLNIATVSNVVATNISGNGSAVTSVDATTVGGNTAATLRSYSDTVASNASNLTTGTLNTARLPATVNVSTVLNVGANVNVNTSTLTIGNTSVNIVANSSSISGGANATFNIISGNGVNITSVDAATVGGNTAATLRSYSDTAAGTAYSNATGYASNASNISSGTLNTARLPATVNVSAVLNVGANVTVNTTAIAGSPNATLNIISGNGVNITSVDASTVGGNTAATLRSYSDTVAGTAYSNATGYASNASNISSGTLNTNRLPAAISIGTSLTVGANVTVNTSTIYIGNTTVNFFANSSIISGNGASISSVNAATVGGNTAATLRSYSDSTAATAYSNGTAYSDTKAATAYSNAASYADTKAATAYSNAVAAIAVSAANAATYVIGGGSVTTNVFTVGTASYFVSNGNVGIGTTLPGYQLDVTGSIRATSEVLSTSDARLKTDIRVIENALDKLVNIRGVTFLKSGADSRSAGVIAQEVQEVLPEVIIEDENGYLSVAYGNMVGLLVEAIKELSSKIDALEKSIK